MGKAVKRKSEEKTSMISKEVTGMGIILFSVLSFFCLLMGDLIYPVGQYVRGFFLGTFGYYSFIFLLLTTALGIRLVLTRSILSKEGKLAFFFISTFVFALFGIIHLSATFRAGALKDCVSQIYAGGTLTLKNATAGGAFFSLICYPLVTFARRLGAYVFFSILIALSMLFFVKQFVSARNENAPRAKRAPKPEKKERKAKEQNQFSPEKISADDFAQTETEPGRGLFIFGSNNKFETKSKKDYKNTQQSEYGYRFAFNPETSSSVSAENGRPSTYSEAYGNDMNDKLKYITTPPRVDLDRLGQSPISAANRNHHSDNRHDEDVNPYAPGGERRDSYRISDSDITRRTSSTDGYRVSGVRRDDATLNRDQSDRMETYASRRTEFGSENISSHRDSFGATDGSFSSFSKQNRDGAYTPSEKNETADRFMRADFSARERFNSRNEETKPEQPTAGTGNRDLTADVSSRAYNPLKNVRTEIREVGAEKNTDTDGNEQISRTNVTKEALGVTDRSKPLKPAADSTFVQTGTETRQTVATAKPVKEPEKEETNPIDLMPANYKYRFPPISLLKSYERDEEAVMRDREIQKGRAEAILDVLRSLKNIEATIDDIIYGPAATRFVLSIPSGVQMKAIIGLVKDFQVRLAAANDIRMLVPIPGTSQIGIEVANSSTTTVGLKEILQSKDYKNIKPNSITFALGKSIIGKPIFLDIMDMPHLIVAGATGTGKSVCLNSMLVSLLYRYSPEDLRLIIVDPKMVEFELYKGLPHLLFNDILANDGRALAMLEWATIEMDRRYMLFKDKGARKLVEYNARIDPTVDKKLPYLIILIDEFAELMMTSDDKKKVENYVGRLAQKARAAGISLIFATQRPSADIIEGSIKTNFTSRICFKTSSGPDSSVILGEYGAEKLLGKGDVLYRMTSMPNVERAQGAYIGDEEVQAVTDYIREHNKAYYDEKALELINKTRQKFEKNDDDGSSYGKEINDDPDAIEDVYKRALRLVILTRNVSKTSLQTKLGVGYPKAAKIIDWMEEMNYVSPSIDNKQRTIYITREIYESKYGEFEENYK